MPEPQTDDRPPLLAGAAPDAFGADGAERFRAIAPLGSGATATVWAVRDEALQRDLAVKVLSEAAEREPDGRNRFLDEARLTASIAHPNVLGVLALDISRDGRPYLAMPRVEGLTLEDILLDSQPGRRHAQLPDAGAAVAVLLGMSAAVASAHAHGVVHQDIKPANVLIGRFGEVLLLDWGSALRLGPAGRAERGLYGTPVYMSPEQARSAYVDRRSDVWALGAVLFHSILLRAPIRDDGSEAFWERKRRGEFDPPTAAERLAVPAPLLAIALRAMAADPAARYPDADAFRSDLLAFQTGQAVAAWPAPWWMRLRRWHLRHARALWGGLAVAALVLGLAGLVWRERLREYATWGRPVAVEDFAGNAWRARWQAADGGWDPLPGGVVSTGDARSLLAWRGILPPDVAIEFTGRIRPGASPGDLSVYWCEGDISTPAGRRAGRRFLLQLGAFDNLYNAIYSPLGEVAREGTPLETGRAYRIRAEISGRHMALWRDGALVFEHDEEIPLMAGTIAVMAWYPGKEVSDLRLWVHGVPERVSALAVADAALADGDRQRAVEWYRRIAATVPALADDARWRAGLSLAAAGDRAGAERSWSELGDPGLRDRAAVMRAGWRMEAGAWREAIPEVERLYVGDPSVRVLVRQHWSDWLGSGSDELARHEALQAMRERCFPEDALTGHAAGNDLLWRCDARSALARCGDDRLVRIWALLGLGDTDAAQAVAPWAVFLRQQVALQRGELEAFLAEQPRDVECLCLAGRAEAAAASDPGAVLPRFHLGRLAEIAADASVEPRYRSIALQLLRRIREAVAMESGLLSPRLADDSAGEWLAERSAGSVRQQARAELAVRALVAGDQAGATRLAAEAAAIPVIHGKPHTWVAGILLPAVITAYAGDRAPYERMLAAAADDRFHHGQRLWYLARRLRGACPDAEFLAQPVRSEAQAWLLIADALRCDLAGRTREAARLWSAFLDLPAQRRLLGDAEGEPTLERLARWRVGISGTR